MPDGKTFGLSTIGQIAVHVQDLDRAVAFYRERLGMDFLFQAPYFKVDDIHGATAALTDRGVTIVDEPHVIAKMDTYHPVDGLLPGFGGEHARAHARGAPVMTIFLGLLLTFIFGWLIIQIGAGTSL